VGPAATGGGGGGDEGGGGGGLFLEGGGGGGDLAGGGGLLALAGGGGLAASLIGGGGEGFLGGGDFFFGGGGFGAAEPTSKVASSKRLTARNRADLPTIAAAAKSVVLGCKPGRWALAAVSVVKLLADCLLVFRSPAVNDCCQKQQTMHRSTTWRCQYFNHHRFYAV
jgi:hypothetical protein